MLKLTRREGESITLFTDNGPIEVWISSIEGGQTRIAIEAPQSVNIVRSELLAPDDEHPDRLTA